MIASLYETKVTRHYTLDKVVKEIHHAQIQSPLPAMKTPAGNIVRNVFVVTPKDDYSNIPNFTQPIDISPTKGPIQWAVDGRAFMRYNHRLDSMTLIAENDWTFQCARAALIHVFAQHNPALVTRLGKIPAKAFIRWITLNLAQRFNLDMETQMRVSVFVAYYYYQLFASNGEKDWGETTIQAMANTVSSVTSVPATSVMDVMASVGSLHTIDRLVEALANNSGSLRLKTLNYTGFYVILSTSWIGVHSRENIGVALEHPPTLIALLYTAAAERSFRKTLLSKRMETVGRASELDQFSKYVYQLVESKFE
jgi:hypothetical protein